MSRPRNAATLRCIDQPLTQKSENRRCAAIAKPVAPFPPLSHRSLGKQRGERCAPNSGYDVPLLWAGASRLQRQRGRCWDQCCAYLLSGAECHGMLDWGLCLCRGDQADCWEIFAIFYLGHGDITFRDRSALQAYGSCPGLCAIFLV